MSIRRTVALSAAFIFVIVTALYLPTLRGGFVYDSIAQVLYSDYIHSPSNWPDVLSLRVVGKDELDRNRPLHLASLMVDSALWGKNPLGYRLTSVLLHALNASLLFLFIVVALRACCLQRANANAGVLAAVFGALLFAVHPLVVEAVAEPSNREDVLVMLPMLIGLLCIVLVPARSKLALNAVLVVCGFLAVLAKESGVAVPFVFAVAASMFGHFRRCLPGLIGGFVMATVFLIATYVWRPGESAIFAYAPVPLAADLWSLLSVQSRIWTLQFSQIVWPWNLCAHYTAEAIGGISQPVAFVALAAVVAMAVFAWRSSPLAALGIAVYAACLLPASNFAAQYHPVADRYLYVPLAGLGMMAAVLVHRLRIQYPRGLAGAVLLAALIAVVGFEYAANLRRQIVWQQPSSLWSDALRQYPRLSQALIGMANSHYRAGDFQSARAAATEAVMASNGRWADAWALRALCEWQTGAREEAMGSLRQAQRISAVYRDTAAVVTAMIFSPEQLAVLADLMRAAKN